MSLMYSRKRRGPRDLPCGIPHLIVCFEDSIPSIPTYCCLLVRSQHFLGGKRSMDPASASYLPSVFDHSHNKSVKTRISRTSRIAGSQVDHVPTMKLKSSRVSHLISSNSLISFVTQNQISYVSFFNFKRFLAAVFSFTRNIAIILINSLQCDYYAYVFHLQFKEQSTAGRPCSPVTTKPTSYWD